MYGSTEQIVAEMEDEHTQWQAGLNLSHRLTYGMQLLGSLYISEDTFTDLVFYKGWKLPSIKPAPRACILLPRVQHDPNQDEKKDIGLIRLSDVTPSSGYIDVEFPRGLTANFAKDMGCQLNPETLRETYWSSPILLFNVYGSHPNFNRAFLIHVYNIRANERTEARMKTKFGLLIPELGS